jgi:pimeloyl-ACP methyl ester carboxylesterase
VRASPSTSRGSPRRRPGGGAAAAYAVVEAAPRPPGVPTPEPQFAGWLRERYLRLHPAAIVGGARNLISALPLGAFLRGIDLPVLVVHGEHDYAWTPPEQALLARTIVGAQRVVIPGSAHNPQREQPEAWAAAVVPFLAAADRR